MALAEKSVKRSLPVCAGSHAVAGTRYVSGMTMNGPVDGKPVFHLDETESAGRASFVASTTLLRDETEKALESCTPQPRGRDGNRIAVKHRWTLEILSVLTVSD